MKTEMEAVIMGVMLFAITAALGTLIISGIDGSVTMDERVSGISVYINGDGTTADHIRGAMYTESGELIAVTGEMEIVKDSWNMLSFSPDVRVSTKDRKYVLAVQGDGVIKVPTDGENYIEQSNQYGNFQNTITVNGNSKLSIYAVYR